MYPTGFFLVTRFQSFVKVDIDFCLQLFVILIFAAIVGGIYWQVDDDCKSGIQNRSVA